MKDNSLFLSLERNLFVKPLWFMYSLWQTIKFSSFKKQKLEQDHYRHPGYYVSSIDRKLADQMMSLLKDTPHCEITENDRDSRFVHNAKMSKFENKYNENHQFYRLDEKHMKIVHQMLIPMKESIENFLGSPWRVINVHAWKTKSQASEIGPSAWHTDFLPYKVLKVMVYLTGASRELGTTEFKVAEDRLDVVEGEPGTWAIFRISDLTHRGVPPKKNDRVIVQVILAPYYKTDVTPVLRPLNAQYPKIPWVTPK